VSGLLPHLSRVCREVRDNAGLRQLDIAAEVHRSDASVSRFEAGQFWPHYTDELVAAYAAVADVLPIELWLRAVMAWAEDGGE
jgi:predicted transcriptional regulator